MKEIYFDNNFGLHSARYAIAPRRIKKFGQRELVVFVTQNKNDGTSLINSEDGRSKVFNHILAKDLRGIELRRIRFIFQWQGGDRSDKYKACWEFPLDFDPSEIPHWTEPRSLILRAWHWLTKQNISTCWVSSNATAGKLEVKSNFGDRIHVPKSQIDELLEICV